jgi:bacillithiol biosynthesis cysteine-adding enzyme BshC
MSDNTIRFDQIPRTSRLYNDFLYDFDRVSQFYQPGGLDVSALVARAPKVAAQNFSRDAVADALADQNARAGASDQTFANIERLRQKDSVVVITGQQAGLFTGPLYTVFKALTAIKLAEHLCGQGLNVVPMFWVASEDHDFEEVNHTRLINREGQLVTITYAGSSSKEGKPVGHIKLNEAIDANIEELIAALPESEFMPRLVEDLRDTYKAGANLADAFGAMMTRLFGKFGVVMINPLDDRLKAVAGEIYARAMSNAPEFASRLLNASAQLEASGYHAQVYANAEAAPLFMLDEGRRTAMTRRDDGRFYLKGSEKSFGSAELLDTIQRCPSCFSPNVTLRPIVQDFLLPTLAYIGGPAEIAYFAQLRPNYGLLNRVDPVTLPRASFTLIEKRHAKTMSKYGLRFTDLFAGFDEVMKTVVEGSLDQTTATAFDETEKVFNDKLDELNASLAAVDPTLADALKGGREKILYQLHNLRSRFIHNRGKRDETSKQQIERLFAALYPNKNMQERELNIFYFIARYGYELIDRIYDEVEVGLRDHKLINL